MLISELKDGNGNTRVAVRIEGDARLVNGVESVYALALEAIRAKESLRTVLDKRGLGERVDLDAAYADGRLNSPISHPDPAHLHLTGTGLTHLGSAATRDSMHKKLSDGGEEQLTDSMKMFRMGLDGGKPAAGETGVQPEWFYKGNGHFAVAPGKALMSPAFASDAGEEPEIAGIYVIGDDGAAAVGFALANEFPTTSLRVIICGSPIRSCERPPNPGRRAPDDIHLADPTRRRGWKSRSCPKRTCAHHRQPRTLSFAWPVRQPGDVCMSICSARHSVLCRRHPH